ncbi:MAG: hypothetical protein GY750_09400 [Lentisphaerae bacterium]|nr:hypothetical protein [Lentisphaerota bacterium]MCP4101627.1 hypothetical protein [Lentisphaerota bacterium]
MIVNNMVEAKLLCRGVSFRCPRMALLWSECYSASNQRHYLAPAPLPGVVQRRKAVRNLL